MSGDRTRVYSQRKKDYLIRVGEYLRKYKRIIVASCNNVSANQIQSIRKTLLGKAILLMGKNTMMKKAIRENLNVDPKLTQLSTVLRGNVGLFFSDENLNELTEQITSLTISAPAKAGAVAPNDVIVPAGLTGLEPTQTSFLQALNINTRITKRQIEIISDVHLIRKGEKVGSSEAALLSKLNINPFIYGMKVLWIYDGGYLYHPKVLKITPDMIGNKLRKGIEDMTALGLALNYPLQTSVPYLISNTFQDILALSIATGFEIEEAREIREFLADPSKFVVEQEPVDEPEKKDDNEDEKKDDAPKSDKSDQQDSDDGSGGDLFGGGGLFD
ncbi:60S ACIDIC ribosomal protein P0 [Anaeramoeba ignava]|uniref:60S ACIDIC ribosomal protein P0 n=1 Tax=Anaeramoeba ignava TaxID=1746090 RepID=A0A9Q0R7E2_ANAIG|nr:60S ACIDIC ribosomal protein P0 [Anaeramoeba ignava]|eukprot:Anaeramoba_ignava/a348460_738.p1 GENE.a348460_738~~a348460_738.p1  ORF type:complete len:330 (-),score=106.62 a348460_738:75-1064(-)